MTDRVKTIEDVKDFRSETYYGHLRRIKRGSEVKTLDAGDESILYREIEDSDEASPYVLEYPLIYGFAEGDSYKGENSSGYWTEQWDFREVPEERRQKVENQFKELFPDEPVWFDS